MLPCFALHTSLVDQRGAHRSSCSMYLKRLRCRHSTRGSVLIFMRHCASCRQRHELQKNLSSASSIAVELHACTRRVGCACRSFWLSCRLLLLVAASRLQRQTPEEVVLNAAARQKTQSDVPRASSKAML